MTRKLTLKQIEVLEKEYSKLKNYSADDKTSLNNLKKLRLSILIKIINLRSQNLLID